MTMTLLSKCTDAEEVTIQNCTLQEDEAEQLMQILPEYTKLKKLFFMDVLCDEAFR